MRGRTQREATEVPGTLPRPSSAFRAPSASPPKNARQIGRPMFLQSLVAPGRRWKPGLHASHLNASRSACKAERAALSCRSLSFSLSLPHVSLSLFFQALNMYHMTEQGTLHGPLSPHLTTNFNSRAVKCLKAGYKHFQLLTLLLHYSKCPRDSIYGFQYATSHINTSKREKPQRALPPMLRTCFLQCFLGEAVVLFLVVKV